MKSSQPDSRVKGWKFSDVSGTDSMPIFKRTLKKGGESVSEKYENFRTLARISSQEDFIEYIKMHYIPHRKALHLYYEHKPIHSV